MCSMFNGLSYRLQVLYNPSSSFRYGQRSQSVATKGMEPVNLISDRLSVKAKDLDQRRGGSVRRPFNLASKSGSPLTSGSSSSPIAVFQRAFSLAISSSLISAKALSSVSGSFAVQSQYLFLVCSKDDVPSQIAFTAALESVRTLSISWLRLPHATICACAYSTFSWASSRSCSLMARASWS